jgi:hypothetical protein
MKRVVFGQNRTQGKLLKKSFIQNFIDFQIHDNNDNIYDTVKTTLPKLNKKQQLSRTTLKRET